MPAATQEDIPDQSMPAYQKLFHGPRREHQQAKSRLEAGPEDRLLLYRAHSGQAPERSTQSRFGSDNSAEWIVQWPKLQCAPPARMGNGELTPAQRELHNRF